MKQFLSNIFKEKGRLTVFPVQTGAGKSYNIAKVLAENFDTKGFPQTFIVSPLWTLIGGIKDDLCRFASESKHTDSILLVKSNTTAWYQFFQKTDNVKVLQKALEYDADRTVIGNLQKRYDYLNTIRKVDSDVPTEEQLDATLSELINEDPELPKLTKTLRNAIRRSIVAPFQKQPGLSDKDKCEQCLKYHPYLEELFPELGFYKYRVICLTADKLHRYSYSIMRGRVDSYWSNIPDGSLVIMDESDQCKSRGKKCFEDAILERQSSDDEDRWVLYHKLLDGIELLKDFYNSDEDRQLHAGWVDGLYKELKRIADDSKRTLNLQYNLDGSKLSNFQGGLGVIYHDMNDISVHDEMQLVIEHREEQKRDYLVAINNSTAAQETRLSGNFADNGITYFFRNVMRTLNKYISLYEQQERTKVQDRDRISMQTREQILREFLNALGIDKSTDYNVLKSYEILHGCNKPKSKKGGFYSKSIYDEGITLTEIQEKNGSRRSCKLNTMCLTTYPEHVLIDLVKNHKCHVVLSSATADVKDPLHNYDFEYLKQELGQIHEMDADTKCRLKEYIAGITPNCSHNVVVLKEQISSTEFETQIASLVRSPRVKFEISNFIKAERNDYMMAALANLLRFYNDFSHNVEAHAAIVVTPYAWTNRIGKEKLDAILNNICPDVKTYYLAGKTLKNDLVDACETLTDNAAKVMCLICYNSGSVGVNYEYEVTSDISNFAVAQNIREGQNKCNFDSIYIEHPTNYISLGDDANSHVRACFDISLLAERRYLNIDQKRAYICKLLRQRSYMLINKDKSFDNTNLIRKEIYDKYPYKEYCVQQVVQALGRLTRTPISRKTLNVYFDERIARIIASSKIPTAATELYRNVRRELGTKLNIDEDYVSSVEKNTEEERIANAYDQWNRQCSHNITTLVGKCNRVYRNPGQDEVLKNREDLRLLNDLFLKYPQVDDLSMIPENRQGFYKSINEIPEDKISPTQITRLDAFMQIASIREYFTSKCYCITPSENAKYWISESATQQLYLPRVAEHAFKALMEGVGLSVYDLPDELYERADWIVEGKRRLYVDVKYWAHSQHEQESDSNEWATKASLCYDGLYVIVNVPIYPGLNYKREVVYPLDNGLSLYVLNGLINVTTGTVDDDNMNNIFRLATADSL